MRHASLTPLALLVCTLVALSSLQPRTAHGQTVRFVEENGVTYRETRRIIRRPVTETETVEQQRTVYREELTNETERTPVTVYVQVTEYRMTEQWHGLLNPFVTPYVTREMRPYSYWQPQTTYVERQVTSRQLVPYTETVSLPMTTTRFVEQEEITRVALAPATQQAPTSSVVDLSPGGGPLSIPPSRWNASESQAIGGIAQLTNDPPRQAVRASTLR